MEDRINRLKLTMIDYTVKQQELSEKMVSLEKDRELLQLKLDDSIGCQQRAIEREDYEEAEQLNSRIQQTKTLMISKEAQLKRLDDDHMAIENKKSDKYKELSALVRRSVEKIERLTAQMMEDMNQVEEAEQTAILDKRKRLHYENIRIEEIKKEVLAAKESVLERIQAIEDKVF